MTDLQTEPKADFKLDFNIVIPARYASSRFMGKPLALIANKTMLQHTYDRACLSGAKEVYIATDDERILKSAQHYTKNVVMTSASHTNGTERLAEVVKLCRWPDEMIVVNVQGDEPLIKAHHINIVAQALADNQQAGMATLCYPIDSTEQLLDPNVVKVIRDKLNFAQYFSRAPIPWKRDGFSAIDKAHSYFRHIGLYAYRAGLLNTLLSLPSVEAEQLESLEQLRALYHGIKIIVAQAPDEPGIGVDVKEDLQQVRDLLLSHL